MANRLNLECDEAVLLEETCVAHGGSFAYYTDELILTNKRFIYIKKSIMGIKLKTYVYPLNQLKIYNGDPQAKFGKISNGETCLKLYFETGEESFRFQSNNDETINKFVNELRIIYGCYTISKKEDWSANNDFFDVNEENEVNNISNYQLEKDEVIIKRCEDVEVHGILNKTVDVLLITNKRIVIEYTTGLLSSKEHMDKYDYRDLRINNGYPQINLGTYDGFPVLELSFFNSHTHFNAQLYLEFEEIGDENEQTNFIQQCVNVILDCVQLNSMPQTINPATRNHVIGFVCKRCGKQNKQGIKFCTGCGAKLEETQVTKEKLTIDEQIELLQKLKSLVDAGVLSQEEFEEKKKEIL